MPRARENQFYKLVWIEKKVNNDENILYWKSVRYLGYKGCTFESLEKYKEYLESEDS
jgi:hypothetical protein